MPSTSFDEPILDRPHPLLPTNEASDFSRNFAELQKRCKRKYSVLKVLRELSNKPARLTGFELEVSQELQSLDPQRRTGKLVPAEALGI